MESAFENEGSLIVAVGNKPLLLNDRESVWLIRAGRVDVFAVRVEGEKLTGIRTHIFRAGQGQALFGMDRDDYGKGIGLLAVGTPGTQFLRIPRSSFIERASGSAEPGSVENLVHHWVTGLLAWIQKGLPPKVSVAIKAGEEVSLVDGGSARPDSGTVWLKCLEGTCRLMERQDLPLIDGEGKDFFPLSSQSWVQAVGETRLSVVDTCSCLREDPSWSGLDRFHQIVLDGIAANIRNADAEERERIESRLAHDSAVFENALSRLGSILSPAAATIVAGKGGADELLAACRLIGEKLAIDFKTPSPEARAGRDPLDAISRASRVRTRQVMLKGEWYHQDHGPLLAFTAEEKKPVALVPSSPGNYTLHNPSDRSRYRVTAEVAHSLAPFGYTFYRPFPDRALKGWDILKLGLHDCSKDIWMVLFVATIGAILGLITPIGTGLIMSTVIPNAARSDLGQIMLILVTCAVAATMFDVTRAVALLRIESRMDASMQAGVMDRLLNLPVSFFRDFSTGDLVDRTLGINTLRQTISGVTLTTILAGAFTSLNLLLLLYYDYRLALIAVLLIVLSLAVTAVTSCFNVHYQRKLASIQGKITGIVLQFITGVSKLRVAGAEDRAFALWAEEFAKKQKIALRPGIVQSIQATFNASFPILTLMVFFAWLVLGRETLMDAGTFAAFNAAYASMQNALLQASTALMAALNAVPLIERARPILETLPEVDVNKASPGFLSGDIEVGHVTFRYSPQGPPVLDKVSIQAHPGEFIALVGGSGSGKSTLLRLLLGFETPEFGTLHYDGQDLATLDVREVRRQIGVVLQNAKVMSGDIFKNIVGSSNLTLDDAWEAARMAGFDEDIKQMPMGMHTVMPPGGTTLSGGQRQRLVIARAVVHKPRILFFDEATSALDNLTQEIVSRSLERLHATRIVIAHRLSTIAHADRIYVLDKGRIVQSGTYEELINQEGLFAELARRQIV